MYSWGESEDGQLGLGNVKKQEKPRQIENLKEIISIACGRCHSLAMTGKKRK